MGSTEEPEEEEDSTKQSSAIKRSTYSSLSMIRGR
jgi:hypothetical protein